MLTRSGWFGRLRLILFGGIGAFALPPFHLVFLFILAVTGLVLAVSRAGRFEQAFGAGWWFGFGHGLIGYYWVANAFLVDAEMHGLLAPFAVVGLAGGLAIFPALTAAITWRLCRWRSASPATLIIIFAAIWGGSEWLRASVFTGFPWNLVSTIWTFSPETLQVVAIIGPYGLGMLTIGLAGLPALVFFEQSWQKSGVIISIGLALCAVVWFLGHIRLETASYANVDGVRLRLIQPNIPQHLKWNKELRAGHLQKQLRLSVLPAEGPRPTHVIWPETAVSFNLSADKFLREVMSAVVPTGGLLVTGALRSEMSRYGERNAYNSIYAIDGKGAITASYDKRHLVPFGEYVPMRWLLNFSKMTTGRVDFQSGKTARVFDLLGLPPVAMLICYEVIFPTEIVNSLRRPGWILNLTNDAWFGISAGPHQHLAAAQLRAVEQGLPVVRVANTGISAVINGHGRVEALLELGKEGYLDNSLPKALSNAPPYGQFGDTLTFVLILIGLATLWRPALKLF